MKSGLLDGAEGNLANDLLDQQLSVQMSGLPGGLFGSHPAPALRQMGAAAPRPSWCPSTLSLDSGAAQGQHPPQHQPPPLGAGRLRAPPPRRRAERVAGQWHPRQLHAGARPARRLAGARAESARTAALPNPVRHQGRQGLDGKVAEVTTTEYVNGVPRKDTAKFRAYDSYRTRSGTTPPDHEARAAKGARQDPFGRGLCGGSCKGRLRHRPAIRQQAQPRHPGTHGIVPRSPLLARARHTGLTRGRS